MIFIRQHKLSSKSSTCTYCDNLPVIYRRYSGEHLCKNCFEKSIEKNIYKTISKYQMLKPEDKIVVALSGGKDSITLLYNLIKIQKKVFLPKPLVALSIDEGIEKYRKYSLEVAKNFCKKYNIEHYIVSFKEKVAKSLDQIINLKRNSSNYLYACNYCATIRRRLLNDKAKELGGTILAMGHNLTDISETFLMNLLYKRLNIISSQYPFKKENQKIKKFYINKITPLMRIPENEISLYVQLKKLANYSQHCPYREQDPILRKRVLDFIQTCKQFSPEVEFNLLNGFLELSEILNTKYNIQNNYHFCQICGYPCGSTEICTYCSILSDIN